jgi:hypothetical protein
MAATKKESQPSNQSSLTYKSSVSELIYGGQFKLRTLTLLDLSPA